MEQSHTLTHPDGTAIDCRHTPGKSPGVVFMGGFLSDMNGEKARAFCADAAAHGRMATRFDYRGHGHSPIPFQDCVLGDWLADARLVLDRLATGPQWLVGSSMGGWLALCLAQERPEQVAGVLTIACAVDFTRTMIEDRLDDAHRALLATEGWLPHHSSITGRDYKITRRLIEEARAHTLLPGPIRYKGPVRMFHGLRDVDIPVETSQAVMAALQSNDVTLTLIKDGDHRLTQAGDIQRMLQDLPLH